MLITKDEYLSVVNDSNFKSLFDELVCFINDRKFIVGTDFHYGYTTLRVLEKDNRKVIIEWDELNNKWKENISRSLAIMFRQNTVVKDNNTDPNYVHFSDLISISPDIFQKNDILCERYDRDSNVCGWSIVTTNFLKNKDISKIEHHHAYHIIEKTPFLLDFLALPKGFFLKKKFNEDPIVGKYEK